MRPCAVAGDAEAPTFDRGRCARPFLIEGGAAQTPLRMWPRKLGEGLPRLPKRRRWRRASAARTQPNSKGDNTMTTTKTLTAADLRQFTGSENWYRHGLVRDVLYTDGAQYLAEHGGAYWLIDEIALAQRHNKRVAAQEFQHWTLKVKDDRHGASRLRRRQRQRRLCEADSVHGFSA